MIDLEIENNVYMHVDIMSAQKPKRGHKICGDLIVQDRTAEASTVAIFDGIGSGAKANISATLNASMLIEMIRNGFTLREAGEKMAAYMHAARESNIPFASFVVARILNDGHATILTYEMPAPIFIQPNIAYPAEQRFFTMGGEVVGESHLAIQPGYAIMIASDGVSQAGMGVSNSMGWTIKQAATYISSQIKIGKDFEDIPHAVLQTVQKLDGGHYADDTTAILLTARKGRIINIMTGPASDKSKDYEMVRQFLDSPGIKIVCGSTTTDIVARYSGKKVETSHLTGSYINPPQYYIDGIAIATEGAFSLNQLYNILDYDDSMYDKDSCVSEMALLIKAVDKVVFWLGGADNLGHQGIVFTQLGLFPRKKIIPFIEEKLRKMGKLVVRKEF